MISFSDSVQNGPPKRENNSIEELFTDFSMQTSTPIATVNNNQSKQTVFFFCLSPSHAFLRV
jgi:hypothetical protein